MLSSFAACLSTSLSTCTGGSDYHLLTHTLLTPGIGNSVEELSQTESDNRQDASEHKHFDDEECEFDLLVVHEASEEEKSGF